VLLPPTIDSVGPESLGDIATCTSRATYADEDALAADIDRYDAIITRTQPVTERLLAAADRLQIVAKHGTGVDNVDLAAASEHGVIVANTPGENANSVAEHAVALLLAATRNVVDADHATRAGEWRRADFRGRDLRGRTLGLFGAGNAGTRVATLLAGFGVTCVAYDPYADPNSLPETVSLVDDKMELFERADDLSVHAPLTPETRHAIGAEALALLPDDGVVVNTARGGIVNEAALATALEAGELAGAGVDVYETEPPAPDDPIVSCPGVVRTQHNAGTSAEALANMSRAAAALVRTAYEGTVPETALNPNAWEPS
jgi:D-3-phosphoglycerate dehydrogenase